MYVFYRSEKFIVAEEESDTRYIASSESEARELAHKLNFLRSFERFIHRVSLIDIDGDEVGGEEYDQPGDEAVTELGNVVDDARALYFEYTKELEPND